MHDAKKHKDGLSFPEWRYDGESNHYNHKTKTWICRNSMIPIQVKAHEEIRKDTMNNNEDVRNRRPNLKRKIQTNGIANTWRKMTKEET